MNRFLNKLKLATRWDTIPDEIKGFRLLCNDPECSLSCANLKQGKLSVTSIHGNERHSYLLSKKDMAFVTLCFLDSLSETDLESFCKMFDKVSSDFILRVEKIM